MKEAHPCTAVIKRYRELGGEIITVGSDAHRAADITSGFDFAAAVLKDCGFDYYTIFEGRKAAFVKL
jgi:histidinol-phosphatase (PHP family)